MFSGKPTRDHKGAAAGALLCLKQYFVSSTVCLMLGAREMKGENGFSALTVRLSVFFLFVFTLCVVLNQQHILILSHLACLKIFYVCFSITSSFLGYSSLAVYLFNKMTLH